MLPFVYPRAQTWLEDCLHRPSFCACVLVVNGHVLWGVQVLLRVQKIANDGQEIDVRSSHGPNLSKVAFMRLI